MQIIGEKINGTRKRVAKAIALRDGDFIKQLALLQTKAGSSWIDLNAGTHPEKEPEDLEWLVRTVQAAVETPLCLDSANPEAFTKAIRIIKHKPMINSINGEEERLDKILPIAAEHSCPVIALAMNDKKIPETGEERIMIIDIIMKRTRAVGMADNQVYIDPLAMTLATDINSGRTACNTIREIKNRYPEVNFTMGLSNISFGLPARSVINSAFLILAMAAGLNSAILDPLDKQIRTAVLAAELILGNDRHCLNFTRAFHAGLFGN